MNNPVSSDATVSDYSTLIDEQTQRFINRTVAAFPDDAPNLTISQQRQLYSAMCELFHVGYPADITALDYLISQSDGLQVPVRQYTPANAINGQSKVQLVYLHGGGFIVGGLESHDDICAEIAQQTGHVLTSVDYRLSPEHKHPDALNDTLCVIEHLWQVHQQPIVVCGDSAGATLAAAACHNYRNRRETDNLAAPTICGMVLIYPGLGGDTSKGSYITHANSPMLATKNILYYTQIYSASEHDLTNPLFAPLQDTDFSKLPPTVVFSAQCDPLSDDGKHYCANIQRDKGRAHWINEQGLVHSYLRGRHTADRAKDSFDRIIASISSLANEQWPY